MTDYGIVQAVLLRTELIKNIRLLVDTWPHDAEVRVAVCRRQLEALRACEEGETAVTSQRAPAQRAGTPRETASMSE